MVKTLISLNELAKELEVNKSTLQYYVNCGLFEPVTTVGRMNIFNRQEFINKFKAVKKLKDKGSSLEEIKKTLDEKN